MTRYYEWDRYKQMSSRQRADVSTSTLFSEHREEKKPSKNFGIKEMESYVNIDWDSDADEKDAGKEKTDADKS